MKNGKIRRFRPRSNKHYSGRRSNGSIKNNSVHNIDGTRNNFFRANNVSKNPHNLERAIEKYKAELVRDMKLMGCTKISDLNRNNLRFRR